MHIKKIVLFYLLSSYLNFVQAYSGEANANNMQKVNQNILNFTKEEQQWLKNNPSINIATTLGTKNDQNGNNIHTDLLKLLNKYGGTNLVLIKFDQWQEALNKAIDGELVFGILNLSWTKERSEKYFNYTMAYNFEPLYLIVKNTNSSVKSLKDLENKTIYLTKGSSSINTIKNFTKNVNISLVNNNIEKYKALFENKNTAALFSYEKEINYLKKYRLKIAKKIYNKYGNIYMGINKKYPQLHSIINKILEIIPKEELANLRNKTYEKNVKHKINENKKVDIGLTMKEKKWISNNNVSIAVEDWSPVTFLNPSLEIDGVSGDFIKLIIKRTGLKVQYITDNWDKLLNDFKNKKIDILPSTYYTKDRNLYGIYSEPYFKMKDYIYVKKDDNTILSMKDLEGKTLALLFDNGSIDKIRKEFPKIKLVYLQTINETINSVLNGKADALFNGQIVIEKKINDEFILGLKGISQASFKSPDLHIFSDINKPILASIIKKGLKSISIEEKLAIANKWLQSINKNTNIAKQINKNIKKEYNIKDASLFGIVSNQELLFSLFILSTLSFLIYSTYSKSKVLNISINRFIVLIVVFEFSIIFFLIYETISLDRVENELALVYKNKIDMVQVMQKLRQSSDDLTKSARTYATTKDKKFKKQYFDILDIRNGIIARPEYYNLIYWDLSQERREQKHQSKNKESLTSIINKLPFSTFQKDLLSISEQNSNDLVDIEEKAFKAMKDGNQELAIKLLYSKQYHKAKEKIMIPLDDLVISLYDNMDNKIKLLNDKRKYQFIYVIITGIFFILGNFIVYLILMKKIIQPLEYLSNIIKKFKNNEKNIPQETFYKDEIGGTIQQFFNMKDSIEEQQKILAQTLKHTKDSIEYSALIQHSILPNKELFTKYFKEYFVIWNPKDIIGGDMYLFNEINEDECVFMIVDCTGHGVPGAFVTMLVKALEKEIFSQVINNSNVNTAHILKRFNKEMKSILNQENNESISNAGFDGGIIYYNKKEKIIKFSGANTELFIMKNNNLEMIKGNRHSIGYRTSDSNYEFTEHIINTKDNMKFYITTDGYLDQNGGEKGFPFGKKRFKNIIQEYHHEEFINQQEIFLNTLYEYQGDEETNDDVTMIVFKI